MYLNGEIIHSGWFGSVREQLTLGEPFYIGGIPPSQHILLPVPVHWPFEGDFKTFSVNSK